MDSCHMCGFVYAFEREEHTAETCRMRLYAEVLRLRALPRIIIEDEQLRQARDTAIKRTQYATRLAKGAMDQFFEVAAERDHLIKLLQQLEVPPALLERPSSQPDTDPEPQG